MIQMFFLFRRFAQRLREDHLDFVLLALLVITVGGTIGVLVFEPELSIFDAAWWTLVTITTVGYGDIFPTSLGGRIVGVLLMLFGIGFLGMLTATLASSFVEDRRRRGKGMEPITTAGHILICGWNYNAREIIEQIRADGKARAYPIVLMAALPESPLDGPHVQFVAGGVSPERLHQANAHAARVAIVLADDNVEPHTRDAKTILDTLTIKTTCPDLYTCVQLLDQQNLAHCKMAKADEVIVIGAFSANLLVQAALDHGVTTLLSEIVNNRIGNDIYKVPVPPECAGQPFVEVLARLKTERNLIVVGVEPPDGGALLANPAANYIIDRRDQLIVIGRQGTPAA